MVSHRNNRKAGAQEAHLNRDVGQEWSRPVPTARCVNASGVQIARFGGSPLDCGDISRSKNLSGLPPDPSTLATANQPRKPPTETTNPYFVIPYAKLDA